MEKMMVFHLDDQNDYKEMELFSGVVTKFMPEKQFGFVRMKSGASYFFHMNHVSDMSPWGIEKMRYIPRFHNDWHKRTQTMEPPKVGDTIYFVIGHDHKGRVQAAPWTVPSEYEQTLKSCSDFEELTREGLNTDPSFRYMEHLHWKGAMHASTPKVIAEGTRGTLFTRGVFRLLPNTRDVSHWWEQDTEHGWMPCKDPWTIRLQISKSKARQILAACYRQVDYLAGEIRWFAPDHMGRELIALGVAQGHSRTIKFKSTNDYEETIFVSTQSQFDSIWNLGIYVQEEKTTAK